MELTTFWFILLAVLWTGYFFLEGFDFGVGMLLHPLGRTETDRRVLVNTIGPVWDGNEVWLLTAGGATFAAFPNWYATLFSGFYLALFLILVALILRGVAFEYRGKVDSDTWRTRWDLAIAFGSLDRRQDPCLELLHPALEGLLVEPHGRRLPAHGDVLRHVTEVVADVEDCLA